MPKNSAVHSFYEHFAQAIANQGTKVILGLVVFLGFLITAIICRRLVMRVTRHASAHLTFNRLVAQTVQTALIILGAITSLGTMGINITAMLTGVGLAGFALGYALKDYLSNILAGYMILFYRPFKMGSTIAVGTNRGKVIDVNLRYTTLESEDQITLIPNASVLSNSVNIYKDVDKGLGS